MNEQAIGINRTQELENLLGEILDLYDTSVIGVLEDEDSTQVPDLFERVAVALAESGESEDTFVE